MGEYVVLDGVRKEVVRAISLSGRFLVTEGAEARHLFIETTPQNIPTVINKIKRDVGDHNFEIVGYSNGIVLLHIYWVEESKEKEEGGEKIETIKDLEPTEVEEEEGYVEEVIE